MFMKPIVLALACAIANFGWCQDSTELPELDAFGGTIPIPTYLAMYVQFRSETTFEIRLVRKVDAEGGIRSLIIVRPNPSENMSSKGLKIIDEYEVNGFSVKLLKPKPEFSNSALKAAWVSRCDDVGQFVVESRPELDEYLQSASIAYCDPSMELAEREGPK